MTAFQRAVVQIIRKTPEWMVSEFQQIGEDMSSYKWRIGDLVNQLWEGVQMYDLLDEDGEKLTAMHVYSAAATLCRREVSSRTIRYYALQSDFYPTEVRQEYDPPLTHSHFDYARRCKNGVIWREILEWAMEKIDERGFPPPVGLLQAHFEPEHIPSDPPEVSGELATYFLDHTLFDEVNEGVEITAIVQNAISAIRMLQDYVDVIFTVPYERQKVRQHIWALRQALAAHVFAPSERPTERLTQEQVDEHIDKTLEVAVGVYQQEVEEIK